MTDSVDKTATELCMEAEEREIAIVSRYAQRIRLQAVYATCQGIVAWLGSDECFNRYCAMAENNFPVWDMAGVANAILQSEWANNAPSYPPLS